MRFCMIGSLGHFPYVFRSIAQTPQVELLGISSGCEDSTDSLKYHAEKAGFSPEIYKDWRKMLDCVRPELVCIDGPFEKHAEMCVESLRRGIHVFCEKPIALTLDESDAIAGAWRSGKAHIRSMVGLRYEAPFQQAAKLVKMGAVGKIKLIHTQKSYKLGERPAFYRKRETYGGTIPWVGSHAIDWILFFSGTDFECVTAFHDASDNSGHGDLEVAAHCLFRMNNGIIADAGIDYLRPSTASSHGDDRVRIAGTKGVIEVMGGRLHMIDADGDRDLEVLPPDRELFSDYVTELLTGRPALVDDSDTLKLSRAVLLARESADTRKTIYF